MIGHPLLEKFLIREKGTITWTVYFFVTTILGLALLSPNIQQFKAGNVEVELAIPHPMDGVPSPAKLEEFLTAIRGKE